MLGPRVWPGFLGRPSAGDAGSAGSSPGRAGCLWILKCSRKVEEKGSLVSERVSEAFPSPVMLSTWPAARATPPSHSLLQPPPAHPRAEVLSARPHPSWTETRCLQEGADLGASTSTVTHIGSTLQLCFCKTHLCMSLPCHPCSSLLSLVHCPACMEPKLPGSSYLAAATWQHHQCSTGCLLPAPAGNKINWMVFWSRLKIIHRHLTPCAHAK